METSANEISYKPMPSSPSSGFKNIVLVGRTGNGKSATGNSIVRKKAFKSMFSSTNVTRTCEKHSTQLEDGQILNVIDTPGWFDHSADPEFIRSEMLKCIDMAKDGIHAILLIISCRTRFSNEEEAGVLMLKHFFGPKIMDYMIVVFTGGDEFEEHHETLDDYLCGTNCPEILKETLRVCGNRCVLFNNKLKVEVENSEQLKQLQALLNMIADNNGGRPYRHATLDTNRGKLHTEISEPEKELSDSYVSHAALEEPACESATNKHVIPLRISSMENERVRSSPPSEVKNLLLVGRTGSGKSATGNTILGRSAFKSMFSATSVTGTCETHTTVLENGQNLSVIDTPGLFDLSAHPEFIRKEMLKCIDMTKDGIHAILLVMKIETLFSRDEEDGVLMLQKLYGPKIMDYMIIVFTNGDEFGEYDVTLDDYLCGNDSPDLLKETLRMCGNRCVLFNNKTQDEAEKSKQLKQLHALLNTVAHKNGGKPYTHEVVDTNGGKSYTHEVVDTNGGKPYTHEVVDTNGGKSLTEKLSVQPEKLETSLMETNSTESENKRVWSSPSSETKNIVLVGRTGNGKSATGNSILGKRAFKSMSSSIGVTSSCEMHTTVLETGQNLAVIDTPGLFDYSGDPELLLKEMLKCMDMTKDGGIHAIILVMTIRTRFSREEEDGLLMLQNFFGPEIMNYMIVVFTGGDQFEEHGMSLDDYLVGSDCPYPLKETLRMCGNRRVLFDNKTNDEAKKFEQQKQLHALLNTVAHNNGGKPYTHDAIVDTNDGKPHSIHAVVDTNVGKKFTNISLPEKEVSALHISHVKSDTFPLYEGAINKQHALTTKVSSSKGDNISGFKSDHPALIKSHDEQVEIAQLKEEIVRLNALRKSDQEKHKLEMEIERAKRKNNQTINLQSKDGSNTRRFSLPW